LPKEKPKTPGQGSQRIGLFIAFSERFKHEVHQLLHRYCRLVDIGLAIGDETIFYRLDKCGSCYTLHAPVMLPDGIFVALHHGMYIGLTELRATADKTTLTTGLTAVKRTYRHQGIARQLKLRSITAATASEYRAIRTTNDTRNHSMLALNEQFGFVKRHLWLEFERQNEKSDIPQAIHHL
jgi:GNAT superfamily N-acetyltransferase